VVAFVESLDPPVKAAITDVTVRAAAWGTAYDRIESTANNQQHSEMPYRLLIAFDINVGPLARCGIGSQSMKSGDSTC